MRIAAGLLGLCLLTGGGLTARVAAEVVDEYTVKAALVLNFARFSEWPLDAFATPTDDIEICVIGDEAVESAFSSIDGERIGERRLRLRRIYRLRRLEGCHVLFISGSDRGQLPRILASTEEQPVLTIGEMTGFAEAGGQVNFDKVEGKLRFEVNLEATRRARLRLSSRLLKLAVIVGDSSSRPEADVSSERHEP